MTDPGAQDQWPFIAAEMERAWNDLRYTYFAHGAPPPGFVQLAEARFREGQREYAGTDEEWTGKSIDWFEKERLVELVDAVIYTAMSRVLHPEGGTF